MRIQISCFIKKNDFNNDFIAISNRFASLQTVGLKREHKGIEPVIRVITCVLTPFL